MRVLLIFFAVFTFFITHAQQNIRLTDKVTLGWSPNIETYFIAERLAVQHIQSYVFTQKDSLYRHQPLVYTAYKTFQQYTNTATIKRIAALLEYLRNSYHDNAQTLQYLENQPVFPQNSDENNFKDTAIFRYHEYPESMSAIKELCDSLRSFYRLANLRRFFKKYHRYYNGALHEVRKDVKETWFAAMEKYYGEKFNHYSIYVMPLMPITYGDDNYRAFGPVMHTQQGTTAAMFMSSSRMITNWKNINTIKEFGFNNPPVTRLLTVHEFGHSFVNPHVDSLEHEWVKDVPLFTPEWQKALEDSYISNWRSCLIEHLVRLNEIRIAISTGNTNEASRLRKMYVEGEQFILIPLLENKMKEYEQHREKYLDYNSFLPELLSVFHSLTPATINNLLNNRKS